MAKEIHVLTDIQLVDLYCEKCRDFINPQLYNEVTNRGLYDIINRLPKNIEEAKAVARARMAKMGKAFGDEEITQISNTIDRIEFLRTKLVSMNMADAHEVIPVLDEMRVLSYRVKDYFKI